MTYGAAVQDLRLDGHDAPLVLGFDRFEDYPPGVRPISARLPAVTPTASAAAASRSTASVTRRTQNFLGKHTLHGGDEGLFQQGLGRRAARRRFRYA